MMILLQFIAWILIGSSQAYQLKLVQVPSYPRPWALIAADGVDLSQLKSGRIHFHGWTQDQKTGAPYHLEFDFHWKNPRQNPTESDLRKMIDGYGMAREVDRNPERLMMVPISRGHCDDYVELKKEGRFEEVLLQVLASVGISRDGFRVIQMSAHSGGGDLLSRILTDEVISATVYDGIYGQEAANRIANWIKRDQTSDLKILTLITIPHLKPAQYSSQILSSLKGESKMRTELRNSIPLEVSQKGSERGNQALWIQEVSTSLVLNHWTLVRFFWLD